MEKTQSWSESFKSFDESVKKIRFAVIGLNDYVVSYLLPSFKESPHANITALISNDVVALKKAGDAYNIDDSNLYDYDGIYKLAFNNNIDVIYLASCDNETDNDLLTRIARTGKHVVCEKLPALSVNSVRSLMETFLANNKKFTITYPNHYEPHHKLIKEWINNNIFGKVRVIECTNHILSKNSSGKIDDVHNCITSAAIDCINSMWFLTAMEPCRISAEIKFDYYDEPMNVKEQLLLIRLGFADGTLAKCSAGFTDQAVQHSLFYRNRSVVWIK